MLIKIDGGLLEFPRSGVTYVRMSEVSHFKIEPEVITIPIGEKTITVRKNQAGKLYDSVLAQLNTYIEGNAV